MEALLLVFAKRQGQAGAALLSDLLSPLPAQACVLHGRPWEVEWADFLGILTAASSYGALAMC